MEAIIAKFFFYIVVPAFGLGIVVFVHELGHFLVGKWSGIQVLKFSIGFGPKIFSWKRGSTEYCLSWLFFGGYVKFLGDELQEENARKLEGGYYSVSPFKRMLTCVAGPGMNLVFAFLVYCAIFVMGRPIPVDEKSTVIGNVLENSPAAKAGIKLGDQIKEVDHQPISSWKKLTGMIALSSHEQIHLTISRKNNTLDVVVKPKMDAKKGVRLIGISKMESIKIDQLEKGGPAERAGLQSGDLILGVSGESVYQWESFIEKVQASHGKEISIEVDRGGEKKTLTIQPRWDNDSKRFLIGFSRGMDFVYEYINPFLAMKEDILNIFQTLHALFARTVSPKGLAGPVGIFMMIGAFAQVGFVYFLGFMALISVNLGVFNVLPIPVLDGGHILFNMIELIFGKPLPQKVLIWIQNAFVAVLISFILYVTYQDLMRWR
ncbi:MAG: RIP metalloprotease RseP [Chlamydiae bacterium]|nr:RIP metalloprotease RseP [Chlamydiota bacterium]MBI3277122.1 RIP metalloprotease RseP [Chlamydiota bacterium]